VPFLAILWAGWIYKEIAGKSVSTAPLPDGMVVAKAAEDRP
jgi:hypothetical protein